MELKLYQRRVVEEAGNKNVIIKMPTGSGKTFVAAELIKRKFERDKEFAPSNEYVAVFLVPTCELVSQQAEAIKSWTNGMFKIAKHKGGYANPESDFTILVSTPEAFRRLQPNLTKLSWKNLSIIVFDEVHHVLKSHPYREIALKLISNKLSLRQVVGLSASLTYAVEIKSIKNALSRLCNELSTEKILSPTIEELIAGGYHPQKGKIKVEPSHDIPEGVIPSFSRKAHLMYESFKQRVHQNTATPFANDIWNVVLAFEAEAKKLPFNFVSPLSNIKLSSWEDYAHKKRKEHCLFEQLEIWYVALRMIVQTWEEEQVLVLQWLKINDGLKVEVGCSSKLIREAIERVKDRASNEFNFMKLERLKHFLLTEYEQYCGKFRCIIFVQQRITAYIIHDFLKTCEVLKTKGVKSGFVIASASAITPSLKISPTELSNQIESFRAGRTNVLVATSVAEEGLDVPSINVIICYNAMKDSVELTQRFGRARQKDVTLIVMEERGDRPVTRLQEVEELQTENVISFDLSKRAKNEKNTATHQRDREHAALKLVLAKSDCCGNPLSLFNEFVQKTKANVHEGEMTKDESGKFHCKFIYESELRTLDGSGSGWNKKSARVDCSLVIIEQLKTLAMTKM